MKNFHVPLPENIYEQLRNLSARTDVPATALAREAIDRLLRERARQERDAAMAAFVEEYAGTSLDLDPEMEAASAEHLFATTEWKPSKKRK